MPLYSTVRCKNYYVKLKSCLSVCLSVCTFRHADNSAVSAQIETGLARNESCVFEDRKVYFYKPMAPTVHQLECLEDEGVSSHLPVKHLAGGSSSTVDVFYFSLGHMNN